MEIKKVENGWEYDGLVFKSKSDAIEAKRSTEKDNSLPSSLRKGKKTAYIIYDSENPTSFGYFVSEYIQASKGRKTINELAQDIGVSRQTFFNWINAEYLPSHKHVREIKRVMKCSDEAMYLALVSNLQHHMAKILGTKVDRVKKFYSGTLAVI